MSMAAAGQKLKSESDSIYTIDYRSPVKLQPKIAMRTNAQTQSTTRQQTDHTINAKQRHYIK